MILMDDKLFDTWTNLLVEKAYNWKQIGVSDVYCNSISEPAFGIRLINWPERAFIIVDDKKYAIFLLRYS